MRDRYLQDPEARPGGAHLHLQVPAIGWLRHAEPQQCLAPDGADRVTGRFFLKQDHQGPPGHAHGGILASALDEAMAMVIWAEGVLAPTRRLEVDLVAPAPVGVFLQLEAQIESLDGGKTWVRGSVRDEERVVAALPGQVVVGGDAGGALGGGDDADLAGAGLAGHGHRRVDDARAEGGAFVGDRHRYAFDPLGRRDLV